MSLTELLPSVQALSRQDKFRLMQELVTEFVQDEAVESEAPAPENGSLPAPASRLSEAEFEALSDELAGIMAEGVDSPPPVLSDYAVSRAGIYEEHP